MTFALDSSAGLLNLAAAVLLGIKVAATVMLLRQDRAARYAGRANSALWWSTKITPLLAIPCLIAAALLDRRSADAWIFALLMAFALIAVPIVVWRRHRRGWS